MAKLRSRLLDRTAHDGAGVDPYFGFGGDTGHLIYVPPGSNRETGILVRTGSLIAVDYWRFLEGEFGFDETKKPKLDTSLMVPRGQPLPPSTGRKDYFDGVQIDLIVQGVGRAPLTSSASGVCQTIEAGWQTFILAPEAYQDQMPIYRLEKPRSWHSAKHKTTNYVLTWGFHAWAPRSDGLFLPKLVSLPKQLEFTPIASDGVFTGAAVTGGILPPVDATPPQSSKPRVAASDTRRGARKIAPRSAGPDPDLTVDEMPF